MSRSHAILVGPFLAALLAIVFCVWTALGNDVNFCVTTGCILYQDFTIAGVSLWWFGAGAFTILAACAILGQTGAGRLIAAAFLLGDTALLVLMFLTAPCVSCLVAAFFFALCYLLFRRQLEPVPPSRSGQPEMKRRYSPILWLWILFFVLDVGQVARSQFDVWAILDESGEPRVRMFFSPSCHYCEEGINALSGNVGVAFYPVADTDADIHRLVKMRQLLNEGMSIAEALGQSADAAPESFMEAIRPDVLLLRFRLLRNKAHVFAAGSQGIPFFEYRGLPEALIARNRPGNSVPAVEELTPANPPERDNQPRDATLPFDLGDGGQCVGNTPCPPLNHSTH